MSLDHDTTRGFYSKYRVERRDGSSQPGGRHRHCEYFVLDLMHDPFAVPALRAYAVACQQTYPALCADLLRKVAGLDEGRGVPELKDADHV